MIKLKNNSIAIAIGLVILSSGALRAQTSRNDSLANTHAYFSQALYGLGLSASFTSGTGLSFKAHLPESPVAFQVTFGILKFSNQFFYDLGGEVQYDLSTGAKNRLYAVGGFGFYYNSIDGGDNTHKGPFRIGLGVGYEAAVSNALGLSISVLVSTFGSAIIPLPGAAMHYYFR